MKTGTIPSSQEYPGSLLHHRSHTSHLQSESKSQPSTVPHTIENEKGEGYRRTSYSSNAESDDFSLWSDTGDLAEQLADNEDPYRIELDPLNREGHRLKRPGHGGGRKKRVNFRVQDPLDRIEGPLDIDKEAIFIPEPPPRHIPKAERLLALIMSPGDPQAARAKGLVGKPLL